jgi:hypothetical protein
MGSRYLRIGGSITLPGTYTPANSSGMRAAGSSGKEARLLVKFRRLFSRMDESNLRLLLGMAQKMARTKAH